MKKRRLARVRLVRMMEHDEPAEGKKLSGRDVVCPYFRREVSVAVSCEGWWKDGVVKLCFENGDQKAAYMRSRCKCMDGYGKCLVARALEHKYGKE